MRTQTTRGILLSLLVTLPLLVAADEPKAEQPKSPKAKAALKKYDRAVEKAKADYDRAVAAAAKELNGELDVALKAAMKSGTLDEAKRIEAVGKSIAMPTPDKTSRSIEGLVGTWEIRYANQTERTYTIDKRGLLTCGGKQGHLVPTPNGIANPVGFENGKRERYTPTADGRLLIEHFAPDSTFPDGAPDQIGVGVRAR